MLIVVWSLAFRCHYIKHLEPLIAKKSEQIGVKYIIFMCQSK